ncbi:MAG TPA: SDR family oxidoreductase [Clostridia bacterium]|nr:SDR family oxidoreductase [Clostridia bacterium]
MKYNFNQNSRFLVTGGAGFIGSNLAEELLNMGFYVRVLDNFATGKRENIADYIGNDRFELIEGDIRDFGTCIEACTRIDYVLHQGALGSVPRSIKDPATSTEVNVNGTLNMMLAARDCNVKRFVYASSSSVYGDEPNLPKVEGREGKLLSPYAITKHVNELYARNIYELYGLPTVGLRYFNVFGKKQDPHSVYAAVIPIFVKKLLNDEAPVINGDGEQSRDFTYIKNVIQANLRACEAGEEAFGEAFNIAFHDRATINQVYYKLCNLLGKSTEPVYGPDRPGDIRHSFANIDKAKKILKYSPEHSLDAGLEEAIEWYKDNL